jgi:hypothetical protein
MSDDPALSLDFLVVDRFLRTLIDARVLKSAFELGLIDRLITHRVGSESALTRMLGLDQVGGTLLFDLLAANAVIERTGGDVRLGSAFRDALRYRDLLETKLDYAGFTITDFADLFTNLLRDPGGFTSSARLFALFDYRRALEYSAENYALTRGWMRITATLTRYEARAAMRLHDFGPYRRVADIGGNSGEFALRLCRRHTNLRATVFDLPLVCEIGAEHMLAEPERDRIGFAPLDVRREPIPGGFDLLTFKSMLHDWPDAEAQGFLENAARAVDAGGSIVIFERAPLRVADATPAMSMLPNLLFFRSYRAPGLYQGWLQALGLRDIACEQIMLDSPWYLISARKP